MLSLESFYKKYDCSYNSPLSCDRPLETAQQIKGAKFCLECGFPATLPMEAEIKGNRGSYRVTKYLGVRGLGRLYAGVQLKNQQPVIIKEYLLPERCFNQDEALKRKETFKRVGGVNLADGRQQNFRLIQTWEAIADEKGERCYLITKDTEPSQTLAQYLIAQGAMSASQVREFLNKALQTLVFLHTQKLRFLSNQVQKGLEHGNINLDSVLIKSESSQQFSLIYFCDLAKWENLFIPADFPQPPAKTYQEDLKSLGLLAFYLWLGRSTNYNTGEKIDPKEHELLPNTDNELKQFIYRLLGFDAPFDDAETARQALLQLSPETEISNRQPSRELPQVQKRFPIYRVLLGILALLLLGGGIWYYFWRSSKSDESKYFAWDELLANFSEVSNVSSGNFDYTGEKNGTWSFILTQAPESENRLDDLLTEPKPSVKATFNYKHIDVKNEPKILIEEVQNKNFDFALTSLEDIITDDMKPKKIAYDGLLVFVTFSNKKNSLSQALQGKITLQQLRQIYTGEVKNWQQIDPNLPNLPIDPYVPQETEAIKKFEQLVFLNNPRDIALFEENIVKLKTEDTGAIQNRMRQAISKQQDTGIISFGILSKTWRQCAGYPLAIVDEKNKNNKPIQPLFRQRKQRPIQPSDDLCDKANYFDVETFHLNKSASYPLGYPIYIVYPKDNSREAAGSVFADMLKTRQGQCLLNKVGLVPLQPIPSNIQNNACESVP